MRVLGVDPGTRVIGYGVVEPRGSQVFPVGFGALRVTGEADYPGRLRSAFKGLAELVREYRPDMVAIEEAFYGRNASAALRMGEGRGVAIVATTLDGLPLFQYSPAEVKKAVVGNGRAHKSQVQEMVRMILGMKTAPAPEDAADALAVAICHCNRMQATSILSRSG
jgi:crossover junction endodeoxyribonuclease RuvC